MAHPALFITSWLMTLPHFWAVLCFGGPLALQWSYISGPCTSIWNHGCTDKTAMLADRLMMTLGCLLDLYYIMQELTQQQQIASTCATILAVAAYLMAKKSSGFRRAVTDKGQALEWKDINVTATFWHSTAHLMVCVSHFSVLYFIHVNGNYGNTWSVERFCAISLGLVPLCCWACLSLSPWSRSVWCLFNAVFWVLAIVIPGLLSLLLIPVVGRAKIQELIWYCACTYFKLILWSAGISFQVVGLENLDPNGNYVFACNHASFFDIPIMFSVLPYWLISISKKSVSRIPIFGWLVASGGSIFVERANQQGSIESVKAGAAFLQNNPRSVLLFPEGRRSDHGEIQDFKTGGFILSIQAGLPVVPVAVSGSTDILGRNLMGGVKPLKSARITVIIGKPVECKSRNLVEDKQEVTAAVQAGRLKLHHSLDVRM